MECGDVVWLKSGSPAMTVIGLTNGSETAYDCQWFEGGNTFSGTFEEVALTTEDPNDYLDMLLP